MFLSTIQRTKNNCNSTLQLFMWNVVQWCFTYIPNRSDFKASNWNAL